jgi:hypothetical protein
VNEFAKTGAFIGGAALLVLLATFTAPKSQLHELFAGEGEVFYKDFTDPAAATELEITQFDEESSSIRNFHVKQDEKGRWVIPSHGFYPADATSRMSKAATMFIGLTKQRVITDKKEQHAQFGVLDPASEGIDTKGRGVRVTLKDKNGAVLSDLILGKEIEGKTDIRYVCVPGKRHVYTCKIAENLTTKFSEWIETDLLKLQSWDITKVAFDNYKVDELARRVVKGEKFFAAKDDASKWTVEGMDAAKEEPAEEKLREITDSLGQIKIVGVRRKPAGLTADFRLEKGVDQQQMMEISSSLQSAGYFPAEDGVFSNEGELKIENRKGLVYTLRFGEIAYGEGDEVSAGVAAKPKDPKPGETGPAPKAANNRYLMVSVAFDPALVKAPTGLRLSEDDLKKRQAAREQIEAIVKAIDAYREKHEKKLPETLAKLTEGENAPLKELKKDPWEQDYQLQVAGETFAVVSFGDDKKEAGEGTAADIRSDKLALEDDLKRAADDWKAHDTKLEEGKKEAETLQRRFGPWYYVIDKTLFDKLKPKKSDLVKPKAATPENPTPGNTPTTLPGGDK